MRNKTLAAAAAAVSIIFVYSRVGSPPSPLNFSDQASEAALPPLRTFAFLPPRAAPRRSPARSGRAPSSEFASDLEIEDRLRRLTIEQKVGQLFIIGFMGDDLDRGLGASIKGIQPGAIIVFGRNVRSAEQVSKLCYDAQLASFKAVGLPLLIAVDQEGGDVVRIRTAPSLPSALALGETHDSSLVEEAGRKTGRLLKALGFNMNLAPVMDVTDPTKDKFIGTRAFGDDPRLVAKMAAAFSRGLQAADVMPTGKHFPGHGGLNADSHLGTPVKSASLAELARRDLVPYSDGAKASGGAAVMIAHVAYPAIDPSGAPATFSRAIASDLLRKQIGFKGVALTDDIEMAGAASIRDPAARAVRAIEAGADLVMIGWNKSLQRNARRAVLAAVRSGRLSENRVDESVRRLLRAKSRYASFGPPAAPRRDRIAAALADSGLESIAERALKTTFDRASQAIDRRFLDERQRAPIFVFSATEAFYRSFVAGRGDRRTRFFRLDGEGGLRVDRVMRANPDAIGVFYVSGARSAALAGRISEDVAARVILVNSEARSAIENPAAFRFVIDAFFRHSSLGTLTARLLSAPVPEDPRAPAENRRQAH